MSTISSSMSGYLHVYEAYRIPKGTSVQNQAGEDVVLSNDEDTLVLTEKSSRQLVEDRRNYGGMLQAKAEAAAQKTQDEASKKIAQDQAKALAVFRSMSNGDNVPSSDESKLMDYDKKLYQAAKMAQAMAQMAKKRSETKKSEWDDKEEEEYHNKMAKLCDESNEAAWGGAKELRAFSEAQKENIVEIDSGKIDFSSLRTIQLGGVIGEYIDLSI